MYCNYQSSFVKYFLFSLLSLLLISCDKKIDENVKTQIENSTQLSLDKKYDSIIRNNILNDNALPIIYLKASKKVFERKNDSFNIIANKLFNNSKTLGNKKYQALHYYLKGFRYQKIIKQLDSTVYNYNAAKNLFIEINDSINAGKSLLNMSIGQKDKNDHHGSEQTAVDGLGYLKNSDKKNDIAALYNVIGTNRRRLLNYKDAIDDFNKAIALTSSKKDKLSYKNNLAATYIDLKEYQKSIALFEGILKDSLSVSKSARVIDNLAYSRWLQNPKLNVEEELMHALKIRDSFNDQKGLIASYTHLTEYFLEKDAAKAIDYSEKVIAVSRKTGTPEAELDVIKIVKSIQPKNIQIRERAIFLQDSIDIVNKKVSTRFAKTKYDTKEAKSKNENLLKEKEQQKQQKILYAIIAFAILAIALVYFYFLYQKHKREKVLEVYNTETRISKKVHDELANDVYNVMMVLQKTQKNKNELPTKILNQVEDIYVRTRNISHENNSIDIGEDYTDGLREMIGDYNTEETAIIIKDIENPSWDAIDNYKKIVVHRVLQELMVNMKKHSKASVVVLTFSVKEKQLIIHYSDNGIGLPFIKASKKDLLNMENRIQSVEGTLNFDSESGKGLKLTMNFPV